MKSIIKPILMVIFVLTFVFLMQKHGKEVNNPIEKELEFEPSGVIYSDIGSMN